MPEYRTRIKIIGDILATAGDGLEDEQGATVTYLIKKTNISHPRLSRILKMLVTQRLVEIKISNGTSKYKTSQNGREFLRAYNVFTEFANDYGMDI